MPKGCPRVDSNHRLDGFVVPQRHDLTTNRQGRIHIPTRKHISPWQVHTIPTPITSSNLQGKLDTNTGVKYEESLTSFF